MKMNVIDLKYCDLYVGTVRGALIFTPCDVDQKLHFELDEHEKAEITTMRWNQADGDKIVIGYSNGVVQLYDTVSKMYTEIIPDLEGKDSVVGIGLTDKNYIFTRHNGVVNVYSLAFTKEGSYNLNLANNKSTVECCKQQEANLNVLGVGGEQNDFKLWDLNTKKFLFKAKSLGNDNLNLPIPTSVRDITFFQEQNSLAACACKEGHALLYDIRSQRRPVTNFVESRASYSCIASTFNDRQCVVGTTKGYVQLLDLRQPKKCLLKTYKSFTGSVTSLVCDPSLPIVVSTSLDRYLRIHDLQTKQCIYEQYMKQSLSKVLFKNFSKQVKTELENNEDALDTIFENMEEVQETLINIEEDRPRKKRRKH